MRQPPKVKCRGFLTMRERIQFFLYDWQEASHDQRIGFVAQVAVFCILFLGPILAAVLIWGAGGIFIYFGFVYVLGALLGGVSKSQPKKRKRLHFRFFRHIRYY